MCAPLPARLDRLIQETTAQGTVNYAFDAAGRRTGMTLAGSTTLHDGINPVQELSGATPTANLLSGLGIDEVFTRTDSAGIQTQYTYAPYGETATSGAASGNAFQYTGRENDGRGCITTGLDTMMR